MYTYENKNISFISQNEKRTYFTITFNCNLTTLQPAYRFQSSTFELLKEKAKQMSDVERHGSIKKSTK